MFASLSTKEITLPGGEVVVIRKLTGKEWIAVERTWRDMRACKDDQAVVDARSDDGDRLTLANGIVSWSVERAVSPEAIADLDFATATLLVKEILTHTRPDLFASPDDARKNDSGPSVDSSTATGPSQISGE